MIRGPLGVTFHEEGVAVERDSVVQESGRSVFKCRGDVAPKGRAFWVRMRLSEYLTTEESNQVKHSLDEWLELRDLGSEGGEFGAWHWQQLVSARGFRETSTQEDIDALRAWLVQQPDVSEWEVSELAAFRDHELELQEGFSEVVRDVFRRSCDVTD